MFSFEFLLLSTHLLARWRHSKWPTWSFETECSLSWRPITGHLTVRLTAYADPHQRNIKVCITALRFGSGIHRWPVNFPRKVPVTPKKAFIWWRHHLISKRDNSQIFLFMQESVYTSYRRHDIMMTLWRVNAFRLIGSFVRANRGAMRVMVTQITGNNLLRFKGNIAAPQYLPVLSKISHWQRVSFTKGQ